MVIGLLVVGALDVGLDVGLDEGLEVGANVLTLFPAFVDFSPFATPFNALEVIDIDVPALFPAFEVLGIDFLALFPAFELSPAFEVPDGPPGTIPPTERERSPGNENSP